MLVEATAILNKHSANRNHYQGVQDAITSMEKTLLYNLSIFLKNRILLFFNQASYRKTLFLIKCRDYPLALLQLPKKHSF